MGFNDGMVFPEPVEDQLFVERGPVTGQTCPRCGSEDVRRYPIGWHRGPRIAVKCQQCLFSLSVDRPTREDAWPPFRSATYDWNASPSERASAIRPPAAGGA
jgi:hypothetical protein